MRFDNPEAVASWPAPNYVNPEKRGPELYIVNSFFFFLASVAVSARLYTRVFVRKWFGLDDLFVIIAFLCNLGDLTTVFWGYSHYWWDHHMWDARPEFLVPGTKTMFVAKILWASSSTFVRLSFMCSFYRLLDHVEIRRYRWTLHLVTFFILGIYFSYLGTIVFACVPVQAYFEWPSPGRCIVEGNADTALSALNTFSEFVVAALPIPVILRLEMDSTQRRTVMSILCLGFFVSIVGSLRTYYIWLLFASSDLTWWSGPYWLCSEVEICLGLICASAPTLRPVFGRLFSIGRATGPVIADNQVKSAILSHKKDISQNQKSESHSTHTEISTHRTFDLEGIAVDGASYTVTISAGRRDPKRKGGAGKGQREGGVAGALKRSMEFARPEWSVGRIWPFGGAHSGRNGRESSGENPGIEIFARTSLEVLENFRDGTNRSSSDPEAPGEPGRATPILPNVRSAVSPTFFDDGDSNV